MGTIKMIMPVFGRYTCPKCKKSVLDVKCTDDRPDDFCVVVCACGSSTGIETVMGDVDDIYLIDENSINLARQDELRHKSRQN